jgi:hypothetical protein
VRPEGFGTLKKLNDLNWSRTRDSPASSIVSTTLPIIITIIIALMLNAGNVFVKALNFFRRD